VCELFLNVFGGSHVEEKSALDPPVDLDTRQEGFEGPTEDPLSERLLFGSDVEHLVDVASWHVDNDPSTLHDPF
jgi:hypothetical protein